MIVNCALYSDGKREPVGMAEAIAKARSVPDSFVWLGLHEPTFDEFDDLALYFAPHPLAIEDAVHAHQRPKLDVYDECLFVVLKTLCYDDQRAEFDSGEIMLFTGDNFMVTVQHGASEVLAPVGSRLEAMRVFKVERAGSVAMPFVWLRSVIGGVGWWGCGSRRRCGLRV